MPPPAPSPTQSIITGGTGCELDRLTTKFQEALGEAQTLALGNDHAYIELAHVLAWPCWRSRTAPGRCCSAPASMSRRWPRRPMRPSKKLPQGRARSRSRSGRDTVSLLQAAEKDAIKRGDQFVASESFCSRWPMARPTWLMPRARQD